MRYAKSTIKRKTNKKRASIKIAKKLVKPSKNLIKVIKQVQFRGAETKHGNISELEYPITTANSSLSPSVNLSDWMALAQGTGDGQRIGNVVNCTKANLNLIVRRNNTTNSQIPCELHVFIGYLKQNRGTTPDPFFVNFYQSGTGTVAWNGTQIRTMRKVNADLFVIFKKLIFKIAPSTSTSTFFNNNDFNVMYRQVLSLKPMLGKISYGDDGTATNLNKDLFMWASYVYVTDTIDNLAVDPTLKPVDLLFYVDTEYKDM